MRVPKVLSATAQPKSRSEEGDKGVKLAGCRQRNCFSPKNSVLNSVRLVYVVPTMRDLRDREIRKEKS